MALDSNLSNKEMIFNWTLLLQNQTTAFIFQIKFGFPFSCNVIHNIILNRSLYMSDTELSGWLTFPILHLLRKPSIFHIKNAAALDHIFGPLIRKDSVHFRHRMRSTKCIMIYNESRIFTMILSNRNIWRLMLSKLSYTAQHHSFWTSNTPNSIWWLSIQWITILRMKKKDSLTCVSKVEVKCLGWINITQN